MPNEINFFDTYTMIAITEEIVPTATFFRDRYFPTESSDIFASDKVLTEYRKGDRKMAAFVAPRKGAIPMERMGYEIHEYKPAMIGVSRPLTLDDLKRRGFGEAMYINSTPAQRAARLQLDDFTDMNRRIERREEWMSAQTMINNACTMQEYIDAETKGETRDVYFYDGTSDHAYTVANMWNSSNGNFNGDVKAMCKLLSHRGLPAADLVLGSEAAEVVLHDDEVRELLDRSLAISYGDINQTIEYNGVVRMGTLNFGGFKLTLFDVSESYEDDNGVDTPYFPPTSAMVTAPKCGHMMYGQISQIPYGSTEYETIAAPRVPKLVVDQENDSRSTMLRTRPLAAPKNYCPYIYAANVVG